MDDEDVIKVVTAPFIKYFSNETIEFKKEISHLSEKYNDDKNTIKESFSDLALDLLTTDIWWSIHKTFVYEFHIFRTNNNQKLDRDSSVTFLKYVNQFNTDVVRYYFKKYPLLKKLVTSAVKENLIFVTNILKHYTSDHKKLMSHGLVSRDSYLKRIYSTGSDPHNGHKRVIIMEYNSGNKLVYKPRSMQTDVVLSRIISVVFSEYDEHWIPKTLAINDQYGWQEFIPQRPTKKSEAGRAFNNLGKLSAILRAIGVTDIHDENILISKSVPYLIDTETLMIGGRNDVNRDLLENMAHSIESSIVGTSIIPAKLPVPPYNVMLGAINTPYPQETQEKVFTMINFGTDAIDIAKRTISIDRKNSVLILENEDYVHPEQFQSEFVQGYRNVFYKILEKKNEILQELRFLNVPSRLVLRPTAKYAQFMDAMLFPEYLTSEDALNSMKNLFVPPKFFGNVDEADKIKDVEWNSMTTGNIPYFYSYSQKKTVCSGEFESSELFLYSPFDNLTNNLKSLTHNLLAKDERFIAEGYSYIKNRNTETDTTLSVSYAPLFQDILIDIKKNGSLAIVNLLNKLHISDSKNTTIGWIGGSYTDLPISYVSQQLISFHDTGGIVLLFQHLVQSGHINYSQVMKKSEDGLRHLNSSFSPVQDSIVSGKQSIKYILNSEISELDVINALNETNMDSNIKQDLFNGLPGIILLSATENIIPDNLFKEAYKKLSTILEDTTELSLAHGKLGILWSMYRVAIKLNLHQDMRQIERKILNIAEKNDMLNSGWCNGYSGLLMVLSEISLTSEFDFNSILLDIAKKSTKIENHKSPLDISVCHGISGVIQSLLYVYYNTNNTTFLDIANNFWEICSELLEKNGGVTGSEEREYLLGYFLGWSGFADSLLLLESANSGKHINFPISFTKNIVFKPSCSGR